MDFGLKISAQEQRMICEIRVKSWNFANALELGEIGLKVAGEDASKTEKIMSDWAMAEIIVQEIIFESFGYGYIWYIYVLEEYSEWIISSFGFLE